MFFELFVRLWTHWYWIVPALNGLGQLGLAKSWPLQEPFRGHSIGTHVLKSLWSFRIAYLCSFLKQLLTTWLKDQSFIRCVVPKFSGRVVPVFKTYRLCFLIPTLLGPPRLDRSRGHPTGAVIAEPLRAGELGQYPHPARNDRERGTPGLVTGLGATLRPSVRLPSRASNFHLTPASF